MIDVFYDRIHINIVTIVTYRIHINPKLEYSFIGRKFISNHSPVEERDFKSNIFMPNIFYEPIADLVLSISGPRGLNSKILIDVGVQIALSLLLLFKITLSLLIFSLVS